MDSHLDHLQRAIASVTRGLTATDLTRHPEGKWSSAEVLEHLYLTYTSTVKGFERCLEAGRPQVTPPTPKQRLVVAEIGGQIEVMDRIIGQCEARYGKRVKLLNHSVLGPLSGSEWRKFHWVHGRHHIKQIWGLQTPGS
jgi:hypothetical protein